MRGKSESSREQRSENNKRYSRHSPNTLGIRVRRKPDDTSQLVDWKTEPLNDEREQWQSTRLIPASRIIRHYMEPSCLSNFV
jgi:hypothetical protein